MFDIIRQFNSLVTFKVFFLVLLSLSNPFIAMMSKKLNLKA